jgi:hypothetical protein
MSLGDNNKLNRIEELKSKLFSKNFQTKVEHRDNFTHGRNSDVPDSWEDGMKGRIDLGEKFFMQTSVFKNFFIISVIFFTLAIFYASYVIFFGGNTVSKDNIEISILGNNFTAGGEDLSLIIGVTNKNSLPLDLVDLVIEYPKNSLNSDTETSPQTERSRVSLGTIPAGAVRNENIKIILFGEQGSVVSLKISIEYRIEGSNAIFVKEKPYEVSINSTPISLSVEGPISISSNENITLDIKSSLNTTRPLSKVILKIDYPVGFQFISAKPAPSLGNNVWSLGDFSPGTIRGIY